VKKAAIIGIVSLAAVVAAIYYSTASLTSAHRVEVCMEFKGMTNCGTARGETEQNAQRAATTVACATLASGVTDSIACDQTPPKKITWK
jgi:hypothetical protein